MQQILGLGYLWSFKNFFQAFICKVDSICIFHEHNTNVLFIRWSRHGCSNEWLQIQPSLKNPQCKSIPQFAGKVGFSTLPVMICSIDSRLHTMSDLSQDYRPVDLHIMASNI